MLRSRAAILTVLAAVAACAGGEPEASNDTLRAALLTSGPVSDAGWYAGAYEGMLLLEESRQAEISHQQTATPAEYDEAFLAYASDGFDLIFAHGFEYQDAAMRAGPDFPNTTFVVSGGGQITDNVVPLIFRLEEATYLAGMAAAAMTESGIIGMVGGVEIPPVQGTFRAFEAGARAVRPDVEILESFTGDWDDVGAAKEAAVAQLNRGVDVLVHNVDAGSFAIFQAVREAVEAGRTVWAIGMNNDQNHVAPDVILGSAVIRIPQAFDAVADMWSAGELGGAAIYTGAVDEVVDFVVNPELADRFPEGVLERIDEARTQIRAGTLSVPRVAFVEGETGTP
ncbi:MAG: BMP family protein [Gemmatimonadota bacterium]